MQDAADIVAVPRSGVDVVARTFEDGGAIPNNPDLPVVVMRRVIAPGTSPRAIRDLVESNGWGGTWQWTVFDFHHYHPNAHEALVVASGRADLVLGGPGGETFQVEAGDALVLPAGTGHLRAASSPDFLVCGSYPAGQERRATLRDDDPRPGDVLDRIRAVPLPATDPIFGAGGPLHELWGASR
ncbi:MAG: cupin domain-containing protein [Rhodobiaceae bacterium]|nr:cupin domain-containing protein [Rhodobiaceae bacterium]